MPDWKQSLTIAGGLVIGGLLLGLLGSFGLRSGLARVSHVTGATATHR